MYLWQRPATAGWLAANERRLEEIAPGAIAIISRPGRTRSLVQVACKTEIRALRLMRRFQGSARRLPRRWQQEFLQHEAGPPIRIGKRLLVVANAGTAVAANNRGQLVIPAAAAFGTGGHATTAMCLRLLEGTTRRFLRSWRMFDAGTGTGILALAARCFGASDALGIDHDPRAVAHALENARLNEIDDVEFLIRDLLQWKSRSRYDIITANLYSEMLIAVLPNFRQALRKEGRIIISGILREQAKPVVAALRRTGFDLEALRRRGKWIALLAKLKT